MSEGWGIGMSLLITNGRVITASDDYVADVYCDGGVVRAIGKDLPSHRFQADRTIDATGLYVMPGGIDVHTHLNMPFGGSTSADDFESGTIAAAFGGTTSIVDFAIQYRGQTMRHALDDWRKRADGKAAIDYGFHMIVTELEDAGLGEMDRMVRDEGITSFKLFMAYPGVFMVDDQTIFRALRRTGENGGLVCMHAENGGVIDELVKEALRKGETAPKYHALTRPPAAEGEATGRAIALAEMAGVPIYIVHLSAAHALEKVRQARDMGLPAYAETCPQYLFLSYDNYEEPGFDGAKYVMSPPLREKWHQDVLWKGLAKNDLQVISTDHCPFCMKEQKELGKDDFSKIPNGAPGIETRLTLVHDGGVRQGRITLNRFVELCATTPAKMFGLFPRKGTIAVGSDADIVVFDPGRETTLGVKTLHMKVDYNPYEGRTVQGSPSFVICNGAVVVEGTSFVGRAGAGRFLRRGPSRAAAGL
jgi:dihydropyrimidinase